MYQVPPIVAPNWYGDTVVFIDKALELVRLSAPEKDTPPVKVCDPVHTLLLVSREPEMAGMYDAGSTG
jgi:hypothetical protein